MASRLGVGAIQRIPKNASGSFLSPKKNIRNKFMLTEKISKFLKNRSFISVATSNSNGRPNAVPKFLLKVEGDYIYIVDYTFGRTYENLKINPNVSLAFMDNESLSGYQVNGSAQIIQRGGLYDDMIAQLKEKEIALTTERVIRGVRKGKGHVSYEVGIPDKCVIFKVKIFEIVEITPKGLLKREML